MYICTLTMHSHAHAFTYVLHKHSSTYKLKHTQKACSGSGYVLAPWRRESLFQVSFTHRAIVKAPLWVLVT